MGAPKVVTPKVVYFCPEGPFVFFGNSSPGVKNKVVGGGGKGKNFLGGFGFLGAGGALISGEVGGV